MDRSNRSDQIPTEHIYCAFAHRIGYPSPPVGKPATTHPGSARRRFSRR